MILESCIEGYKILGSAFGKKIEKEKIEKIHRYFFIKQDGKRFLLACKNIAEKGEKFPHISTILREMQNVTIEYDTEEISIVASSSCDKCINGLVYYEDDLGYEYVGRCDCKKGINLKISIGDLDNPKPLPFFKNLPDSKFKRKITINEQRAVSDRECQEMKNKMWEQLGRPDLVKPLPSPNTYDNSEYKETTEKIIASSRDEITSLINMLGGEKPDEKEKERTKNIEEKIAEDDDLPF